MIRLLLAVIVLGRVCSPAGAVSSIPSVSFKSSSGGGQVSLVRKGGTKDGSEVVKVTVSETVITRDAPACSLLYPVLALDRGGAAALSALQGQGLDCSVTDAGSQDCQTQVSPDT